LDITRHFSLMLAVNAGLIFNGDEKNCEKLGSWAQAAFPAIKRITVTKHLIFFINLNLTY